MEARPFTLILWIEWLAKLFPLLYLLITDLLITLVYNACMIVRRHGDSSVLARSARKLVAYSEGVEVELGYIKVIASGIYSRKPRI
jgi:hypothetical protein